MNNVATFALGLLLILGTSNLAWTDTPHATPQAIPQADTAAGTAPALLAAINLKDQHGTPHTLDKQVQRIYYTRDMGGGKLMKKVFGDNGQAVIDGTHTIAISNVSAMNSFIRNTMALPALKKRPYLIWIDDSGQTNDLPYRADAVSIIDVSGMAITATRFASDVKTLQAMAGLPQ